VVNPEDSTYDKQLGAYPRPTTDISRFCNQGWDKLIIRASEFVRMSQWCHHAEVKTTSKDMCLKSDFLGLLHYHDTGFRRKLESAARVLKTFSYIPNIKVTPDVMSNIEDVRRKHQACQVLIKKGVACGHKLEYYDLFLRRALAIHALKDLFDGRTPSSNKELDDLTNHDDPEMIIMQHRLMNDLPEYTDTDSTATSSSPNTETLLYHDSVPTSSLISSLPDKLGEVITHVKNFFMSRASLSSSSTSISGTSSNGTSSITNVMSMEDIMNRYASTNNMYGTDKTMGHAYGPLYSYLLDTMRRKGNVEAVLEIGVFSGASVQSLSEYFPQAVVVGIDITLDHVKYGKDNPMVTYIKGDGTSADVAKGLSVYFDVVLDDGSHLPGDQIAALDAFAPFLRPGGMYIIEDISSRNNLTELRDNLEIVAKRHGLVTPIDWYDMRHIAGRFDDIVAVIRRAS
jgi:predicted O-methyltransferase YrrM